MSVLPLVAIVSASLIVIDVGCYFWLRANHARRNLLTRRLAGRINP